MRGIFLSAIVCLLGACAAVSGLDALEVCDGAACALATGIDGGQPGADGGSNDDAASGYDGRRPDDGSDISDANAPDRGSPSRGDAGTTDSGIGCGATACTGTDVCCVVQAKAPACQSSSATCDGGARITCDNAAQCQAGQVCCGVGWGKGLSGDAVCKSLNDCSDFNDAYLCKPGAPQACPAGSSCNDTARVGGQTFSICF